MADINKALARIAKLKAENKRLKLDLIAAQEKISRIYMDLAREQRAEKAERLARRCYRY